MNIEAIKDLLYRIADDELVIGHRGSEWTGIGPILEEDIAFSSMAQDEVGHAQAYYIILNQLFGEADPDVLGFGRKAEEFRNSTFTEYPITDYAFSLIRHLLYDVAEGIRLESLSKCSFMPIAELAKKLAREERYHYLHAVTWINQLGRSTEDANKRLQVALDLAYPMAYGLFEPSALDAVIADEGLQATEGELEAEWEKAIAKIILDAGLKIPEVADKTVHYGGRQGKHTPHLSAMLAEMGEVYAIDPAANW